MDARRSTRRLIADFAQLRAHIAGCQKPEYSSTVFQVFPGPPIPPMAKIDWPVAAAARLSLGVGIGARGDQVSDAGSYASMVPKGE